MILISLIILYMFYAGGGFRYLIKAAQLATEPEPETVQYKPEPPKSFPPEPMLEPKPAPVIIQQPEPVRVEPIPEPKPEPPQMDRRRLEQTARNCLTAAGCKFDVWHYCRNKSDIELMDIIAQYNLNN